jgi:hypothetical protein
MAVPSATCGSGARAERMVSPANSISAQSLGVCAGANKATAPFPRCASEGGLHERSPASTPQTARSARNPGAPVCTPLASRSRAAVRRQRPDAWARHAHLCGRPPLGRPLDLVAFQLTPNTTSASSSKVPGGTVRFVVRTVQIADTRDRPRIRGASVQWLHSACRPGTGLALLEGRRRPLSSSRTWPVRAALLASCGAPNRVLVAGPAYLLPGAT